MTTATALTVRDAVPDVQPVVLAVSLPHLQGVMLQVKGQELQDDLHLGFGQDGEGAVQVVWVLLGEAGGLDGPVGACEVFGTIFRAWRSKGTEALSEGKRPPF